MTHGPVGDSASGLDYEESEHSGRVVRIASVAALGGFLFGFDSSVINGAVSPIQEEFEHRRSTPGSWSRLALLGCALGAWSPAGWPTRSAGCGDADRRHPVPHQLHRLRSVRSASGTSACSGSSAASASASPRSSRRPTSPRSRRRASAAGSARCSSWRSSPASSSRSRSTCCWRNRRRAREETSGSALRPGAGCSWSWPCPPLVYGGLAFTIPESPRYLVCHGPRPEARKVLSTLLGPKNRRARQSTRIQDVAETEKPPSWRDLRKRPPAGCYGIVWVGILAVGVPAVRRHQRDLLLLDDAVAGRRLRRERLVHHHRDHVGHQRARHAHRDRARSTRSAAIRCC